MWPVAISTATTCGLLHDRKRKYNTAWPIFARYSNYTSDGYGGNLHMTLLQIFLTALLPNIIEIGQNLRKLLQKINT